MEKISNIINTDKTNNNKSILFLHRFTQNSKVFEKRLKTTTKMIKKNFPGYNILIPDAPHILDGTEHPDGGLKRGWLYVNKDDKTEFSEFEKAKSIEYLGLDESIEYLINNYDTKQIEMIFGFSQGALITTLLSILIENEEKYKNLFENIKCVIIAAGFIKPVPTNELVYEYLNNKEKLINVPSLHIYGKEDEFIVPERSKGAAELFLNPEIHEHEGKHFIPSSKPDLEIINNFMKKYLI